MPGDTPAHGHNTTSPDGDPYQPQRPPPVPHTRGDEAMHDPLTGLPNRIAFSHALFAVTSSDVAQLPVGLCHLDIDGFTAINHTLGHDVGDRLLQAIARRLSARLGADRLLARTGNDEFTILMTADDLAHIAVMVQQLIRRPFAMAGQQLHVTASVGVVAHSPSIGSAVDLMSAAEAALAQAKTSGRDHIRRFDPEQHARQVARHEIAQALPQALERGELFVEYQPIVRAGDGELYGVEALARWHHPEQGRLSPAQFIPVAEDTGLIGDVGRFVLRTACVQAARWNVRHPGRRLVMSVNIAPAQADDPAFAAHVAGLLAQHGIDPDLLQLEVTETCMMPAAGQAVETLHALARLGVRIAIDDFGTGYANLTNLRSLPVHQVKLARQFVYSSSDVGTDQVDYLLIEMVVRLARSLGLGVIAEGVESEAQVEKLRLLGCDIIQGYVYGAPQSPDAIDARLGACAGQPPRQSIRNGSR
ncbi:putative bifunctional diguanylate cyclase/phosphodiesterase [Catellatospora citrea]|nr:bifunctional diguanylate cyclase/phosphodiesterase [Catellatospora citrea]